MLLEALTINMNDTPGKQDMSKFRWYAEPADKALEVLGSDADHGLDGHQVEEHRTQFGSNELSARQQRSPLQRLLSHFNNLFIYLLLIAGVVTALLSKWVDSVVIFSVVLINGSIGFIQEGRAERALESVQGMLSRQATVWRDGRRQSVSAEDVVPGDIVQISAGERIPADLRLLRVENLEVQEAVLTGESNAVEKQVDAVDKNAEIGDRASMAYSGTLVIAGQGIGVVVATGDKSEIGRISGMLADVKTLKTPLMQRFDGFTRMLSVVILGLALITFTVGTLVWSNDWQSMFLAAVSLAVAAIPQGLPAVMTVILAIGVERMAGHNAIIRRLPAVETLGSVTVICADKTGTLTRNEMTVKTLRTSDEAIDVEGVGYEPTGGFLRDEEAVDLEGHEAVLEMLRAGLLCNNAELVQKEDDWQGSGDPTEVALVVAACKAGLDPANENGNWRRVDSIPFASENRYMATLNHDNRGNHSIYVKGAPEKLLDMCSSERCGSEEEPLDREAWEERIEEIAARGQRLLAIAHKAVSEQAELSEEDVERDLVLLGLFGMIDPPRQEAIESIAICRDAGIGVKMITGDHAGTAMAVARELGLETPRQSLRGRDIEKLGEEELRDRVMKTSVFARTSPEHKLRLVEALQAQAQIIAMTGDGVNDAPALKRANLGIAMGQKGTEAAREASEMVLADDNFASIERAVQEGRKVHDNLRKTILFVLPTNAAESLVLLASVLFGLMLPVTPVQILWVNMITAVTLGVSLAWEKAEGDLMHRGPHSTEAGLLGAFGLWRIAYVGTLLLLGVGFLFVLEQGRGETSLEYARTMAVNALVLGQIFYLLNSRFFRRSTISWDGLTGNRKVLLAIFGCIGLQILFTYAPFMNDLLESRPLDVQAWLRCGAVGLSLFVLVEIEKFIQRRRSGHTEDSAGTPAAAGEGG